MTANTTPGLGELLRYVGELVDHGAEQEYRALSLTYRARYTPVMRALNAGAETVTDITARSKLSQGAISQTVGLMVKDGLLETHALEDGRKSGLHLTAKGAALLEVLLPHWEATFRAISALEREVGHPLLTVLQGTARALEREGFAERLRTAKAQEMEAQNAE